MVEPGAVGAPLPSEAELVAMKMPALRAFAKEHCGDGAVSLALGGEQRRTKVDRRAWAWGQQAEPRGN